MKNLLVMKGKMMVLKVSLLIVFAIMVQSIVASAQSKDYIDTVTTKRGTRVFIREDHSDRMKIMAQAKFFDLECGTGDAFKVGMGLEGDYFLPKMASVHIALVKDIFDIQKSSSNTFNNATNALSSSSFFEVGGRFHLIDMKAKKRFKTKLSHNASFVDQYNSGGTIPENYLIAKLPARRILAVRGGIYRNTAIVNTDMNSAELKSGTFGAVQTKDGAILSNIYYTNAHTTGVYVGLSEIYNIWVKIKPDVDGFRNKIYTDALFKEVYADVLLAGTSFDPFVVGGVSHDIDANTKGSFQTSKLGFRLGKKVIITRKMLNLGFSFELGARPGVKGRGAYFGTGMSLAFVK